LVSGSGLLAGASRSSGVVLLLAVLLVPVLSAGPGGEAAASGREVALLLAPDAAREVPSEGDAAADPLLLLVPAGVVDRAVELPEPSDARAALRAADRLGGAAVLPFPPPPPRRA
jgi:hypothetical protein